MNEKAGQAVMTSLWKRKKELKTIAQKPSSADYDKKRDLAQGPEKYFLKRPSPLAPLFKWMQAGMTVEAAIALPLCLLFLMNMGYAVEMIRLHNNLQFALWDAGGRVAMYGCEQEGEGVSVLLTDFYIGNRVRDSLGEEYLDSSPLVNGSNGLRLWETGLSETGDELNITLTYQVRPLSSLVGFRKFRMANHCCVRLWNGYDVTAGQKVHTYVYVADNGVVYHRDRKCTHLQLSVHSIFRGELADARNRWGSMYSACEKCVRGEIPDMMYVTEDGNCYHYRENCPGLKRTVTSLTLEEAAGYRPCSRCGGF